jgi:hypothetical protein
MRMEQSDQFLRTKTESFEVKVTETNLLVLTGCCDLEAIAHAILAVKPFYFDGDSWTHKNGCHWLETDQMIQLKSNLIGRGFPNLGPSDSRTCALMLATPDDRALLEEYVRAASVPFGVPCKHGEKIKPQVPSYEDAIIKIDAAVSNPARLVSAYGTTKGQAISLSCILCSSGPLGIAERGLTSKINASATLTNTTTVMMVAREQNPTGEATLEAEHETSSSDGFGSIELEELWVPGGFGERFKPIAGFDLATKLKEMGVLAGEPKFADVFTHYPVTQCPFDPQHRRAVLSQHRSGTVTYLCPHYSCRGKKDGFGRKTARDYFAYYGVTIPGIS